jgi:adenine-specific DNA-methyltransferase
MQKIRYSGVYEQTVAFIMLNLILDYTYPENASNVSGIPGGWNRSCYIDQMVDVLETTYNTFRGSRNLNNRDIHVKEYLYLLEK